MYVEMLDNITLPIWQLILNNSLTEKDETWSKKCVVLQEDAENIKNEHAIGKNLRKTNIFPHS